MIGRRLAVAALTSVAALLLTACEPGTYQVEVAGGPNDWTFDVDGPGVSGSGTFRVDPTTPPPTTTAPPPPPTTTPPPPPPTTTNPPPPPPPADTAAARYGWGTPLPASDEFGYTGTPNSAKWQQAGECWPANPTVRMGRCASRSTVDGSKLVMTGRADGRSPWLASKLDQRYGRWEARVRSYNTAPSNGRTYHPLFIIWPQSNQWPVHGEYDFLENGSPGEACAKAFLHYPGHTPKRQEAATETNCGAPLSEWHNIAFEWTPQHVKGFVDGKEWFSFGEHDMTAMPSGHLTIQLDNFDGANMTPASYEVDWVRIYRP